MRQAVAPKKLKTVYAALAHRYDFQHGALPLAAFAAHGKAGLWNVTVTMQTAGMQNENTISMQHCMTAAEVDSDRLSSSSAAQQGCTMNNMQSAGHTLSSDMVCNGTMKGEGHMAIDYDSPEHYAGRMTFSGTARGQPANITSIYDGKWLSANCSGGDR